MSAVNTEQIGSLLRPQLEPVYRRMPDYGQTGEPWRGPGCHDWTNLSLPLAQSALRGFGIQVERFEINSPITPQYEGVVPFAHHEYLVGNPRTEDQFLVDGTWGQRASREAVQDMPRIMVATPEEAAQILAEAEVAADMHFVWRPDMPVDGVRYQYSIE